MFVICSRVPLRPGGLQAAEVTPDEKWEPENEIFERILL